MMGMIRKEKGNMMGMDMGNVMSNWKDQEAELDKLVADMNSAPSDKKVDAIAAVVTKLVEQHKGHARANAKDDGGGREGYDENGSYDDDDADDAYDGQGDGAIKKARERANTRNIIELKSLDRHPNPDCKRGNPISLSLRPRIEGG
jgi:hypothetical protein